MARIPNERAARDAARANIQDAITASVAGYAAREQIKPTAYDLWQIMKRLAPAEYARDGLQACFESCANVGFMEAALKGQPAEEADEQYRDLVWDEFSEMVAETAPKEGLTLEYMPCIVQTATGGEELAATVVLYRDGFNGDDPIAAHTDKVPEASCLYKVLKSVIETNDSNVYRVNDADYGKDIPGPIYDAMMEGERRRAGFASSLASRDVGELMSDIASERPFIREMEKAVDEWAAKQITIYELRQKQNDAYDNRLATGTRTFDSAETCTAIYLDQYERRRGAADVNKDAHTKGREEKRRAEGPMLFPHPSMLETRDGKEWNHESAADEERPLNVRIKSDTTVDGFAWKTTYDGRAVAYGLEPTFAQAYKAAYEGAAQLGAALAGIASPQPGKIKTALSLKEVMAAGVQPPEPKRQASDALTGDANARTALRTRSV